MTVELKTLNRIFLIALLGMFAVGYVIAREVTPPRIQNIYITDTTRLTETETSWRHTTFTVPTVITVTMPQYFTLTSTTTTSIGSQPYGTWTGTSPRPTILARHNSPNNTMCLELRAIYPDQSSNGVWFYPQQYKSYYNPYYEHLAQHYVSLGESYIIIIRNVNTGAYLSFKEDLVDLYGHPYTVIRTSPYRVYLSQPVEYKVGDL